MDGSQLPVINIVSHKQTKYKNERPIIWSLVSFDTSNFLT